MRPMVAIAALLALPACSEDAASTTEIKTAAEQRARQVLNLPADAALEATMWVGDEDYEGATVLCGTVSASGQNVAQVPPQRFAATSAPIHWIVFEDAHNPIGPQGEKFPDWSRFCGEGQDV